MNFTDRLREGKMSNKLFKAFQDEYPIYYEYELVYFDEFVIFSIYNELKEKLSCYKLNEYGISEMDEGGFAPDSVSAEIDFEKSCKIYRKFLKENFSKCNNNSCVKSDKVTEEINSL